MSKHTLSELLPSSSHTLTVCSAICAAAKLEKPVGEKISLHMSLEEMGALDYVD